MLSFLLLCPSLFSLSPNVTDHLFPSSSSKPLGSMPSQPSVHCPQLLVKLIQLVCPFFLCYPYLASPSHIDSVLGLAAELPSLSSALCSLWSSATSAHCSLFSLHYFWVSSSSESCLIVELPFTDSHTNTFRFPSKHNLKKKYFSLSSFIDAVQSCDSDCT